MQQSCTISPLDCLTFHHLLIFSTNLPSHPVPPSPGWKKKLPLQAISSSTIAARRSPSTLQSSGPHVVTTIIIFFTFHPCPSSLGLHVSEMVVSWFSRDTFFLLACSSVHSSGFCPTLPNDEDAVVEIVDDETNEWGTGKKEINANLIKKRAREHWANVIQLRRNYMQNKFRSFFRRVWDSRMLGQPKIGELMKTVVVSVATLKRTFSVFTFKPRNVILSALSNENLVFPSLFLSRFRWVSSTFKTLPAKR